jgi:hypothetical protein
LVLDQFKRLMTAGNKAITDSDSLDAVASNVIGKRNITHFYDYKEETIDQLNYKGN